MLVKILFQSDWWWHVIASLVLWALFYLIETYFLKRNFAKKKVLVQLLLANLIDLDHLLSVPIFDANRCSINNHVLHSWLVFPGYLLGLFTSYRYFFSGVILHLIIDYLACIV